MNRTPGRGAENGQTGFSMNPEEPFLAEAGRASVLAFERDHPEPEPSSVRHRLADTLKRAIRRGPSSGEESEVGYYSSTSPSETLHGSYESDLEAGTTAVDHGLNFQEVPQPVLVEPQPGSDYAKMDSPPPPPSEMPLSSYILRFQKFLKDLHSLPWIGPERITVDFVPGQSQRDGIRSPRRPIFSWYNENTAGHTSTRIDLLSSGSPSPITQAGASPPPVFMRTASLAFHASGNISPPEPVYVVYPNGYTSQQPSVSAYPNAVVFPADR